MRLDPSYLQVEVWTPRPVALCPLVSPCPCGALCAGVRVARTRWEHLQGRLSDYSRATGPGTEFPGGDLAPPVPLEDVASVLLELASQG